MNVYNERRVRFMNNLEGGVAIIPAARPASRNADNEYEFRQDSDFFYLTGFAEPDAVLVLAPQREEAVTLFVRPRDPELEVWNGPRAGVEGALAQHGANAAHPIAEFDERIAGYLVGASNLHYSFGLDEGMDRRVLSALARARHTVRRGGTAPETFLDPAAVLHEMRLFKSEEELATMRRCAAITRDGHIAAMRATRPGMAEYELEAILEYHYRVGGAQDLAYPSIVAGGARGTILHYNTNRETLKDGDLVLVDSGAELDCYASDVTRTWPVNGRFSREQRALYEIVLRAQEAAIAEVRPGNRFSAYHEAAVRTLVEGLIDIGLLWGSLDENLTSESYRKFYMHRTGHWLGLDVHDAGRYTEPGTQEYRVLEPGMVLTVEPGLYVRADIECDERFKGIGIRIEDDIVCTAGGCENLSAQIPKSIADLESIVGSAALTAA